jgi:hypothetical protein
VNSSADNVSESPMVGAGKRLNGENRRNLSSVGLPVSVVMSRKRELLRCGFPQ